MGFIFSGCPCLRSPPGFVHVVVIGKHPRYCDEIEDEQPGGHVRWHRLAEELAQQPADRGPVGVLVCMLVCVEEGLGGRGQGSRVRG